MYVGSMSENTMYVYLHGRACAYLGERKEIGKSMTEGVLLVRPCSNTSALHDLQESRRMAPPSQSGEIRHDEILDLK